MAVLNAGVPTLLDVAKRLDPDGKIAEVAEMLSQNNPILDDMPFIPGNLPTGHQMSVRTGLPAVYWRLINQGVPPSKSTTAQITEQTGFLEAWSDVDERLAELNGNTSEFRLSEASAFVEAMSQEGAQTIFYGNAGTSPEEFNGLSVRYSSLGAGNAQNIIDAGGEGSDNTSIWLIGWGEQGVFGLYPKGTKAGIDHFDWGKQVAETTAGVAGNRMAVYRDQWKWTLGVGLKDWRCAIRVANIDVSDLVANDTAKANLIEAMVKAVHRIPTKAAIRPVFYMNRTVAQMLDIQVLSAVGIGGGITFDNVMGKQIGNFRGFPVRSVDALLETEARVV